MRSTFYEEYAALHKEDPKVVAERMRRLRMDVKAQTDQELASQGIIAGMAGLSDMAMNFFRQISGDAQN